MGNEFYIVLYDVWVFCGDKQIKPFVAAKMYIFLFLKFTIKHLYHARIVAVSINDSPYVPRLGIVHCANPSPSLLLLTKPQAFSITCQTPAIFYYYLTNPSLSLLFLSKPQPFSIITKQTPALLYYYIANPSSSLLLLSKPQLFSINT